MQPTLGQNSRQTSFLTIAQLFISSLGLLGALAGASLFLISGLINLFSAADQGASTTALFSIAWVCGLVAVLAFPSLFFSLQRLRGTTLVLPRMDSFRVASVCLLIWPLVILLGSWASAQASYAWLVLPPLQILAISLPVWWVIAFARRGLTPGSLQRSWGIVNFSLLITTPLVVFVEMLVFLFLLLFVVIWILDQPALLGELEALALNFQLGQSDPESILPMVLPFIQKPGVIIGLLASLSGIVPLIEEFFKPLAIWFFVSRKLTAAEGFAAGALCGGSFALLESLLSLASPTEQGWIVVAVGRAGTALLHITTSALIGWAMANAGRNKSYLLAFLVYLSSAGLHGLWNALSVFWGMNALFENTAENSNILARLAQTAPVALGLLTLFIFALLWAGNRRLRQPSSHLETVV